MTGAPIQTTKPTPDPIEAESGVRIALPVAPLGWEVSEGTIEVYLIDPGGRSLLAVLQEGSGFLPATAAATVELRLVSTAPVRLRPHRQGDPGFGDLAAAWLARLDRRLEESAPARPSDFPADTVFVASDARLEALAEATARTRAEADAADVARLSQDLSRDRAATRTETALRALAEAFGLAEHPITGDLAQDQVPALCRRAGLRARKVLLEDGWHRRDQGHLLLRPRAQEETGLDALIWDGLGYRGPDGTRIGPREAEAYAHEAYSVSAPLPDGITGFRSLAIHVLRTTNRRDGLTSAVAAILTAGLGVLIPLATVWLLSDIVPAGNVGLLAGVGIALGAAALFTTLLSIAQRLATERIDGRGWMQLNAAVADRVLRLPTSFFKGYAPGDLNQRIEHLEDIRELVISITFNAVLTAILSVVYLAVLFIYDAQLALIGVGLVIVYILAVVLARLLQMRPLREAAELDGEVSALTYETLDGVAKLRASAAEDRAMARLFDLYVRERLAQLDVGKVSVGFDAFSDAYQTITLMILFAGAGALVAAEASAGVFIGFLAAFGSFQAAIIALSSALLEIYAAQPLMDRARPILEATTESAEGGQDPGTLKGQIEASGLSFAYQAGAAPVIDRLDFKVNPGEHMAIVGGSGSGKSTLMRLLLGFETPQTGSILYDGQELSHLDLTRVRGQIGVVLQSSELFAGSILDNIRGASDASLDTCLAAADAAGLSRDLEYFAMGVHTPITEGAAALSGGQRQRILIARALAGTPNILLFDEATSALDNATQAIVAATLDSLNVTRITIAHRLSTVRHADRICVLQDGRFVEQGAFEDLMARDGAFVALARRQLTEG